MSRARVVKLLLLLRWVARLSVRMCVRVLAEPSAYVQQPPTRVQQGH